MVERAKEWSDQPNSFFTDQFNVDADEIIPVKDGDAYETARKLAAKEGIKRWHNIRR